MDGKSDLIAVVRNLLTTKPMSFSEYAAKRYAFIAALKASGKARIRFLRIEPLVPGGPPRLADVLAWPTSSQPGLPLLSLG
jgi:hypothetical protein